MKWPLAFLLLCSCAARGQPAAEGASLALIHANIIDGTLDQVLRDATVLIRDGRIEAVGSASVPPGAEVLDLDGHCLLPGLIDAHAHLFNLAGARRVLEQGATTVRGALTQLPGSPFHTQAHSFAIGIDRSGRFAYEVVFELGGGSTFANPDLRSFAIGATGSLTEIPGSRLLRGGGGVWGVALTH